MYDVTETPKLSTNPKNRDLRAVTDLPYLGTSELSFDLHSFIGVSNQVSADTLFANIFYEETSESSVPIENIPSASSQLRMPQSSGYGSERYVSEASVKQELASGIETQNCFEEGDYTFASLPHFPEFPREEKRSKKSVDKASDEYHRRRERNNIAVRKSREKAKQRSKDTERRVGDIVSENDILRKRVELLSKELSVLKNLLSNVGVSSDSISKH